MRAPSNEGPHRRAAVAILFFSGVGGTRVVAELLGELVGRRVACEVLSIEDRRAAELAAGTGLIVLCYPTYFLKPAPAMQDFIRNLRAARDAGRAVLVATYELYTGNANRFAALMLRDRGLAVVGAYALRSPGTDVTGVLPARVCGWLYRFERGFPRKIVDIARAIAEFAASPRPADRRPAGKIPAPKWYTPLAWVLQVLALDGFIRWRDRMRVLSERCASCDLCVRECPRGCWRRTAEGLEHRGEDCDLCMRCVHHCPERAIVLLEGLKDNRRLDPPLYAALKEESLESCVGPWERRWAGEAEMKSGRTRQKGELHERCTTTAADGQAPRQVGNSED